MTHLPGEILAAAAATAAAAAAGEDTPGGTEGRKGKQADFGKKKESVFPSPSRSAGNVGF